MLLKLHVLQVAGVLVGTGGLLAAADFVAPAEGPVAFRRDKVPLDAETMASLSKQLETLASGPGMTTAANRRATAQMLALATTLDPSNASAREAIANCESDSPPPAPDPVKMEKFNARVWQYISWLETPEAGTDGHALAACLSDVMAISDPKHPRNGTGENGAWTGWVAPVSAFEPKAIAKIQEPESAVDKSVPENQEITLTQAEVSTPMWQKLGKDDTAKWVLAPTLLKMSAKKTRPAEGFPAEFTLAVKGSPDTNLQPLSNALKTLLKKTHGKLPLHWSVTITCDELQKPTLSGKRQSISAAAAVLASAAIAGREPNATIIGVVDEEGTFKLPTEFWDQLCSLGKGNGGRLVLPAAAAEFLPSFLALEKPQFFFDYEVVLAANFTELLDLSAKTSPDPISAVSTKFHEIRAKGSSQPVGQYVANIYIRRRLADLAQEAPYHFSSRMLAIQGAGNRPTQIPRTVLIPELRRAISPMAWLVKLNDGINVSQDSAKIELLAKTYETCRVQVDALERYTTKEDHDLLLHVKTMVAAIRPIERAARARSEDYVIKENVITTRTALIRLYDGVIQELNDGMGEPEPSAAP